MVESPIEAAAALPTWIDVEAELGGDHDLITKWSQGFAHQFFVFTAASWPRT